MIFPLGLILVAMASAFAVAYGTDPRWVQYPYGLDIIVNSRKFQWPLVALSLVICIGLLGLIVSGRRRAWWLIGLGPVLALFVHRFALGPAAGMMAVVENPSLIDASDAHFLADEDYVVGLSFGDVKYAFPYSVLFSSPVVIQADHDKRMMLLWSAYANRALAVSIHRDLKARDLEVVSSPANALLVYDARLGQFINGLKGQTTKGEKPTGFGAMIATQKMPWSQWRALHPDTKVMPPTGTSRTPGSMPTRPLLPTWPLPPNRLDRPADLQIALIGTTQPTAIDADSIGPIPLNLRADNTPVLVFRENPGQPIRALSRQILPDLLPRFMKNTSATRHPKAVLVDVDTNSGWDANGAWTDGLADLKGKKLEHIPVDDGLYWGVMKFWYPDLELAAPATQPVDVMPDGDDSPQTQPAKRRRATPVRRGGTAPGGARPTGGR